MARKRRTRADENVESHSPSQSQLIAEVEPADLLRQIEDRIRNRPTPVQAFSAYLARTGVNVPPDGDARATLAELFSRLMENTLPVAPPDGVARLDEPGFLIGNELADGSATDIDVMAGTWLAGFRPNEDAVTFVFQERNNRVNCWLEVLCPEDRAERIVVADELSRLLAGYAAFWTRIEARAVSELHVRVFGRGRVHVGARFVDGTRLHDDASTNRGEPFDAVFVRQRIRLPSCQPDPDLDFLGPVIVAGTLDRTRRRLP